MSYGRHQHTIPWQFGRLEVWSQCHGCDAEDDAQVFILKFGGTSSRAERSGSHPADFWPHVPAVTWAVNSPGYGGSSGAARLSTLGDAGRVAYRALAKVAAGRPILVSGNSLGSVVAMHVVARCPADGVILRNPPALREVILDRFGWWNLGAHAVASRVPRQLCTLRNAARCHVPAVFVTSGRDRIVPPRCQGLVYSAYAGPKQRFHLESSGHTTPFSPRHRRDLQSHASWLLDNVLRQSESMPSDSSRPVNQVSLSSPTS